MKLLVSSYYKSSKINGFSFAEHRHPQRKEVQTIVNKLYVGVDVSEEDVKVYILDQEGIEATQRFFVDYNPSGAETVASRILECCHQLNIHKVFAGLESTSVYGWHLQFYLADHLELIFFVVLLF